MIVTSADAPAQMVTLGVTVSELLGGELTVTLHVLVSVTVAQGKSVALTLSVVEAVRAVYVRVRSEPVPTAESPEGSSPSYNW